jgi:hypothetical protein
MDVATFLDDLCDDLAGCGINSRQLAALEFAADGHDINVRSCKNRGGVHYPDLWTIVADIGRTLDAQGVAVGQLRRMIFLDTEISVELVDADGRISARSWPLTRFGARTETAVGRVTWTIMDEANKSEPVLPLGSMELPVRRV